MRFNKLDLNLLVAFEALVTTRSITRAAVRLSLSQPATSAALGRLRDFFQDPLLVRDGKNFYPTSMAQSMLPLVRQCLRDAEALLAATEVFDPATSKRTFRIIASDYITTVVVTRLATLLAEEAPGIGLEIVAPTAATPAPFQNGSIDLMICPEPYADGEHPSDLLFEEMFVFAGCAENKIFERGLSSEDIANAGHVVLMFGQERTLAYGEQQLAAMGIERRIDIACSSFTGAPLFLPGTSRLMLMHLRLARYFEKIMPIRYASPPFAIAPIRMMLQYPRVRREDAGLSWLRAQICSAAELDQADLDV